MAMISILGLYNYDESIFDDLTVPTGMDKAELIETILFQNAELELLYSDPATMKLAIKGWSAASQYSWEKLQNTLTLEYNPIWNKDGTITETESVSGESSGSNELKVSAYNDSTWSESYGVYEPDYDRTNNSQTNVKVTLTEPSVIIVLLDTSGEDEMLWPVTYTVVPQTVIDNTPEDYKPDFVFTGKEGTEPKVLELINNMNVPSKPSDDPSQTSETPQTSQTSETSQTSQTSETSQTSQNSETSQTSQQTTQTSQTSNTTNNSTTGTPVSTGDNTNVFAIFAIAMAAGLVSLSLYKSLRRKER